MTRRSSAVEQPSQPERQYAQELEAQLYYSVASLTVCCWNQMPIRGSEYQNFNESCIRKAIKCPCIKVTPGSSLHDQ